MKELGEANHFLPVFSLDSMSHLRRLTGIEGRFGILIPITSPRTVLEAARQRGKPFYIDSGIFEPRNGLDWHEQRYVRHVRGQWMRTKEIAPDEQLRQHIRQYFEKCDRYSPDYVFAPDVLGRPLESLRIARLALDEYWRKPRTYELIGVAQVGTPLYDLEWNTVPIAQDVLPHYKTSRSLIAPLLSQYRNLGYSLLALGGLLKFDPRMPMKLKFGLRPEELDKLLSWARPDFVLAGLSRSRAAVLHKHGVAADSTNWLWWNKRYDPKFDNRNEVEEIYYAAELSDSTASSSNEAAAVC